MYFIWKIIWIGFVWPTMFHIKNFIYEDFMFLNNLLTSGWNNSFCTVWLWCTVICSSVQRTLKTWMRGSSCGHLGLGWRTPMTQSVDLTVPRWKTLKHNVLLPGFFFLFKKNQIFWWKDVENDFLWWVLQNGPGGDFISSDWVRDLLNPLHKDVEDALFFL